MKNKARVAGRQKQSAGLLLTQGGDGVQTINLPCCSVHEPGSLQLACTPLSPLISNVYRGRGMKCLGHG